MRIVYRLILLLYFGIIRVSALFSPKARLWVRGRRGWKEAMQKAAYQGARDATLEGSDPDRSGDTQSASSPGRGDVFRRVSHPGGRDDNRKVCGQGRGDSIQKASDPGRSDATQKASDQDRKDASRESSDQERMDTAGGSSDQNMEKDAAPPTAWFHCASLGEFEQGRPVLERFREDHPHWRILLTFFSPSGYEHRKDYRQADHIFYLPADTPSRVRFFLDTWKPSLAVFVKYEYWFNYLDALHRRGIPHIVISAIFRPGQHFFRPWGAWFRRHLSRFSHIFVQDEASAQLLGRHGIHNHTISGDTRFDRVHALGLQKDSLPQVEAFAGEGPVLVAGSTWPKDEALLSRLLAECTDSLKLILAPHEVNAANVSRLKAAFEDSVCLSDFHAERDRERRVLIIDRMGILSKLYRYGQMAYIGGGFGQGIHNILEAATYGMPIIFGPRHQKFAEARDLLKRGGAFCVADEKDLLTCVDGLLTDEDLRHRSAVVAREYVEEKRGGTECVMEWVARNPRLKPGVIENHGCC